MHRTPRDTLNPAVTDLDSPVTIDPITPTTIAPRAKVSIPLAVDCPALAAPLRAPEAVVELSFTDSKGRTVPVAVRRRLPIARTLMPGVPMPLEEWEWTPYATDDAPPTVTAERSGESLVLTVRVPDDRIAESFPAATKRRDRATNPLVDAMAIRLHGAGEPAAWTWEPSTASVLGAPNGPTFERVPSTDGWSARCTISPELLKGVSGINIGVADNDDTFHTQWRWLSPSDLPATLGVNQR